MLAGRIMHCTDKILAYGIERYVYMGGAHGSTVRSFTNYCLKTGAILREKDLFSEGYEAPLRQLLLMNLVEQNEDMQLIEDLQNSDYQVDEIRPNGNFYITEEGITYVFNQYEIAPYAYGEIDIFISNDQLTTLLRHQEGK